MWSFWQRNGLLASRSWRQMRVGCHPSSLRPLGNGHSRAAAEGLWRLPSQARYGSHSFHFPFQKVCRVFFFSKFCLVLIVCHYQIKFKIGDCSCASTHALEDLPLTSGCSDMEMFLSLTPPEPSCSLDFFFPYRTACTYFPILNRYHQESGLDHCSVDVCSKNWPCKNQQFADECHGVWEGDLGPVVLSCALQKRQQE